MSFSPINTLPPGPSAVSGVYQLTTLDGSKCLATQLDPNGGPNILVLKSVNPGDIQTWWIYDSANFTLDSYKYPNTFNSKVRLVVNGKPALFGTATISTIDLVCDSQDTVCKAYSGDTTDEKRLFITDGNLITDPLTWLPPLMGSGHGPWAGGVFDLPNLKLIPYIASISPITVNDPTVPRLKVVKLNPDIYQYYQTCNPMCACKDGSGTPTRCKEGMLSATNTIASSVVCDRYPKTSGTYDPNNKYACCMGQFITQEPYLIQNNVPVIYIYDTSYGQQQEFIIKVGVTISDTSFPMMVQFVDGDQTGSYMNASGFSSYTDPLSQGYNYILGFPQPLPSNVTQVNLYQLLPAIDGNKCDLDWCPFSNTCQTYGDPIRDFCSGLDSQGHPLVNTDPNCHKVCEDNNWGGSCGDSAQKFCQNYPNHPACGCQNFQNSSSYQAMQDLFKVVTDKECPGCKAEPPPVCWATPCTQEEASDNLDARLLTSSQRVDQASCQGLSLNICQQLINAQTTYGNITIDNNTFKQACGQSLPNPPSCTYSDWSDWSVCTGGNQTRTRSVVSGTGCTSTVDTRACTPPDPNCSYSDWSAWSDCVNNIETRTRSVVAGTGCTQTTDSQSCGDPPPSPSTSSIPLQYIVLGGIVLIILIALLRIIF